MRKKLRLALQLPCGCYNLAMPNNIPKSHLFVPDDLSLFEYNQVFSCSSIWLEEGMDKQIATFDLLVRDIPDCRNFLVFTGLEEILEGLRKWSYTEDQIQFLLDNQIITSKFGDYLRNFKFSGDIWAMPEGSIFFPGETVIRVTAPIIEANLITMFLTNVLTSNTTFASKVIRCVLAAAPNGRILGSGGMRAQSFESSMKCNRSSYIVGAQSIASIPATYKKYGIPMPHPIRIAYHAFIKSFPDEISAMRAISRSFPNEMLVMVDTYDIDQGIRNAIFVAKELRSKGEGLRGIYIDSGDLFEISKKARLQFDAEGLTDIKIFAASNLDEYKIVELQAKGAPIDNFSVITEGVTSADAPKLEVVYKMAQLQDGDKINHTAKFAPGKLSYPGVKQIYRQDDKDIIGLASEEISGRPLLIEMVRTGEFIYTLPSLDDIKSYFQNELSSMPKNLFEIDQHHVYPVETSNGLGELLEKVRKEHFA